MTTSLKPALVAILLPAALAAPALADTPRSGRDTLGGNPPAVVESVEAGTFLPLAFSPRVGAEAAFASVTTSYEGAGGRAVFEATAEARLLPWLAVRSGIAVRSSPDEQRPLVGVRAQVLDERSHGLDASVGMAYEPDGIREAEGRISAAVALARHVGGVGIMSSLAYGQDAENDDRELEARAAALVRVGTRVHAGLAAGAWELFSDDEKRKPGEPDLEITAGPLASVAVGSFAVFAQAGVDASRVDDTTKTGLLALGGMGAIF